MFNPQDLWKERFGTFAKETGSYLRYIFNGHLMIVVLFLLGTAAFYYQDWIKTLQSDFPAAWIIAFILAAVLTYSPVQTFLTEADKIFLLPLETKLGDYFRKSVIFSLSLQSYLLLMVLAVLMPLHVKVHGADFKSFFILLIAVILIKLVNLLIRWHVQHYIESSVKMMDSIIRFFINTVLIYFIFSGAQILFAIVPALIFVFLYLYYKKQTADKGLKWEQLIEDEERRMNAFYRVANMFTDVPKLRDRTRRRKWLDWLVNRIPYRQDLAFSHLYIRTFARAGDYFGLLVRLTAIGGAALYFLTYGPGQILFALLFMYLTGFQLLPLWNHHENKLWVSLYPLSEKSRRKSFTSLLLGILIFQTAVFAGMVLIKGELVFGAIILAAGVAFALFFVYFYSINKLKS
ncbi:ABC transporter permease [Mesobacillus sp. AQ2]|jgi:ABC-2 type transport system permease protein|uniref:ABC transporter permease n=1 Tax=unclassified Mesobacillus TaxID=2675270 RepID=UPI0020419CF5|nr:MULTISPECIES: ABC transporter permease [unclassified Mesobacillus]MCM3125305.1 ABC transporter permease [Mesobacillus sp. MER 33]MCM3235444.1 ABC transporter permease [Mesobacillus sp. MER 48]WHX41808.1 ABC transporter permease [Mesobacillus sp. AQ2]